MSSSEHSSDSEYFSSNTDDETDYCLSDSSIEEDFEKCFRSLTLQPFQFEPERAYISSVNDSDEECDNNVTYKETDS